MHNVLTEATCEYSFCVFFAVNTLKDTSGFFNMLLLIYGDGLPPLYQKPLIYFKYREGIERINDYVCEGKYI